MTNIYNLFKFLGKQEGTKTPLKVKLIYAPDTLTPDDLKVGGGLSLRNTEITTLPDGLVVGSYLDLSGTKITSLPDGLEVGGYLDLNGIKITTLPDDLKIKGSLDLRNTPLGRRYTKEEIEEMIEDKGGNISSDIYI